MRRSGAALKREPQGDGCRGALHADHADRRDSRPAADLTAAQEAVRPAVRRHYWMGLLLLLPGVSQAMAGGWHASDIGPGIGNRGVQASSRPLAPRQPVTGMITQIAWRYQLASPAPAGLEVKLCSASRCTPLEGGSGTTSGLANVAAGETLRFVYLVAGKGRLYPPLRVVSNQVMVNYR